MNINKIALGMVLTGSLLLGACGNGEEENIEDQNVNREDAPQEEIQVEEETKQEKTSEIKTKYLEGMGNVTPIAVAENGQQTLEMGPMIIDIKNVAIMQIEAEENAFLLDSDAKDQKAIIVDMTVKNTSDDDVTQFVNQSIMVTDTGEQIESNLLMMGDNSGDFLGQVEKSDITFWTFDDNGKEIKSAKMIIEPPIRTEDWEELAEEQRIEFNFISAEEGLEKGLLK